MYFFSGILGRRDHSGKERCHFRGGTGWLWSWRALFETHYVSAVVKPVRGGGSEHISRWHPQLLQEQAVPEVALLPRCAGPEDPHLRLRQEEVRGLRANTARTFCNPPVLIVQRTTAGVKWLYPIQRSTPSSLTIECRYDVDEFPAAVHLVSDEFEQARRFAAPGAPLVAPIGWRGSLQSGE